MTSRRVKLKPLRFGLPSVASAAGVVKTIETIASYDNRKGYDPDFLGKDFHVPLPKMSSKHDPLAVQGGGKVLNYHNFSTSQSKKRRVPIFSACNIKGSALKKVKRSNKWHLDPRIDSQYQILEECYGNAADSFFSRGHMTRREDPVWGRNSVQAERDTFVATNAAPQMQGHNSPVWLGLEDYVLRNAGKDRQLATVITGPVLRTRDPVIHGVKIPVEFWKIVAFIHDDTGELASVAYLSSQAEFLPTVEPTFVWGQFKDMQVTVGRIEQMTGLKFGPLKRADVLAGADATFARQTSELAQVLLR
jgi:endonuclease G